MARNARKLYIIHDGKAGTYRDALYFDSAEDARGEASDDKRVTRYRRHPKCRRFYARLATAAEVAEYERQDAEDQLGEYHSLDAAESGAGLEALRDATYHRLYPHE